MSTVVAALSVYVEPLAARARIAVLGDASLDLAGRLVDLGARSVHVFDPDVERAERAARSAPRSVEYVPLGRDFDVRDAAFDLAIIPDLGVLPDPGGTLGRLRRIVDPRGGVVALARARVEREVGSRATFPDLEPAQMDYAELYDLFAVRFEHVTMTGVLPFNGVVFAELGADEDVTVGVDTRASDGASPEVFAVVAGRQRLDLDAYSIVQTDAPQFVAASGDAAAFAAMQLKAELLASQVDELRARLVAAEARGGESSIRLERLVEERDVAIARSVEIDALLSQRAALESALGDAQEAMALHERRMLAAERLLMEREARIDQLSAELAERQLVDPSVLADLATRAERAEAVLALHVADLAQIADAHANETASLEKQLRERASVIAALERELKRREQIVRELVTSLEEAGGDDASSLRRKLDELALDIARREGELVAQRWRIAELEGLSTRAESGPWGDQASALQRQLAKAQDELDALRQALTQEHAARVAAEQARNRSKEEEEERQARP